MQAIQKARRKLRVYQGRRAALATVAFSGTELAAVRLEARVGAKRLATELVVTRQYVYQLERDVSVTPTAADRYLTALERIIA